MEERGQWQSNIGFLFAAIGSAIGLGNIWRFPYVAYKSGGGAFFIPYITALFTAGIPILMLELSLGNKLRASAPKAFRIIGKKFEWLGWWAVSFVMFGIEMYYIVIIGWCANFLVFSFTQAWGADPNTFFFTKFLGMGGKVLSFQGINFTVILGVAVIWFVNWFITSRGIEKGIEKAVKIMMPLLFVITVVIIIWSMCLEGARAGIVQYIKPDFARITDIKVWIMAYGQIFFSLSLGFGIMIAYASYLPKKTNIFKNSLIIGFSNSSYEVFAGFGVFSILGYMATQQGKPIQEVVTSGLGLAFVAYPQAISLLPLGIIFGILFFFLLAIAGVSSSISIIEAFSSAMIDKFNVPRRKTINTVCAIGFIGSMIFTFKNSGLHMLDIVDHFINQYGLITVGVIEAILIGWLFKTDLLKDHMESNLTKGKDNAVFKALLVLWKYCIKFVTPVMLGGVIIYSLFFEELVKPYEGYPIPALIILGIGWLLGAFIIALLFSSRPWKNKVETVEELA